MALAIPTVTFQYITEKSQTVIYNILKNNITTATSKMKGRGTVEVRKKKDFPLIEVNMPMQDTLERNRTDYNHKKIRLVFEVIAYSRKDAEAIQLGDLIQYTLDSNQADMHTGALYKFHPEGIKPTFEWDGKLETKVYKTTVTFSVLWSGN